MVTIWRRLIGIQLCCWLMASGALAQPSGGSCPADLNDDDVVELADLAILLLDFGCDLPAMCPGDADGDGDTDATDLALLLSLFGTSYVCDGDTDCDFDVDLTDLANVLGDFGCTTAPCQGDANGDGVTNLDDLAIVLANNGQNCVPGDDGTVDLDIDSDNDNGTGLPDRSTIEDDSEAIQASVGKAILVNDDDDDRDGTIDNLQTGTIAAEEDDLVPIVLEITPPGTETIIDYQLDYNQADDGIDRLRVWRSATRGVLGTDDIPPGQVEQYTVANGPITLWVEGLVTGTSDEVQIAAMADGDGDGVFGAADVVFASTFALAQTPTSVTLGTPVQWSILAPSGSPAFTSTTTSSWTGLYRPDQGVDVGPFTASYDATEVRESSATSADLVVGDATFTGLPPFALASSEGALDGHQSFDFGGGFVGRRATSVDLVASAADWEYAVIPSDGLSAPYLGGSATAIQVLDLPVGAMPNDNVLAVWDEYHYAVVVRIEENSVTLANASATVLVDIVSLDQADQEVDRLELVLHRDDNDGDPSNITYTNDLTIPLIFVDESLDRSQFILSVPFRADVSGTAIIVPPGAN